MDIPELYVPHTGWFRHGAEDEVARFLAQGWFEYKEQAFVWLYLRPGDTFLDCGAHIGLFSVIAGQAIGNTGTVIALEPHPESALFLQQNLGANGVRCGRVRRLAISSRSGAAVLHPGPAGRSAYSSLSVIDDAQAGLMVEGITLDELLAAEGISTVQFAKIDIEGAELEALSGAAESIGQGRVPLLMIECTDANLKRFGANTETLFSALNKHGYQVCRFDAQTCQLVSRRYENAIGYDNLFAAQRISEVNSRLATASESLRKLARDILARGEASEILYRQAIHVRQVSEEVAQARLAADQTFRALGEANWRTEQADKRTEAADRKVLGALAQVQESGRQAEEALRGLAEANGRVARAEEHIEAADRKVLEALTQVQESERQAEQARNRAEDAFRSVGEANRRVAQAQVRIVQSEEARLRSAGIATELSRRMDELLASRYIRAGWKFGLSRKPSWIDDKPVLENGRDSDASDCIETEMMRALRHLSEKQFRPRVVLDVGAGKGYWSIIAGGYFPESSFYLIEPLIENESDLHELCLKDPRQHYIPIALGKESGRGTINVAVQLGASTLLTYACADSMRSVDLTTADRLLEERRILPPNLVKIDVQGMELAVLRGGQNLCESTEAFIIKVNLFPFTPDCSRVHEIIEFMAERHYYLFDLAGSLRRPYEDDLGQLDLVMVSASSPLVASNRWE